MTKYVCVTTSRESSLLFCSLLSLIFLSVVLIGCSVGPQYEPPEMDISCEWHSTLSEGMQTDLSDCFLWWENLNDPVLNWLIEQASEQNLDLHIAATRILTARSEKQAKKADLYPHIDASANYGHVYYSKDALVNGLLGTAVPVDSNHVKRNVNFFEVGFDAEWEIDFFGMTAHEINALKAKVEASEESLCDVWVTLSAEVAKNYIQLRGYQQRLNIIQRDIESQQDALHLMEELLERGVVNTIDLSQARELLSSLKAQKPLIELGISKTIHRLSILLGYAPGDLFSELINSCNIPVLPNDKPIGVPSELLRRRPDIRKAERELAAATERVGSAIAALFPRLSLRGFIGDISTHPNSLFNPASATWFAGPQLLLPIFNSKLLVQDVNYNKILTQQALYEYQKTVLEALEETENAIASFHSELERNCHLSEAYHTNQENVELTIQLYQRGIKNYLDVLTATRRFLAAEDAYVQSQVDLLLHYVSLYKALGGGWGACDDCVCAE